MWIETRHTAPHSALYLVLGVGMDIGGCFSLNELSLPQLCIKQSSLSHRPFLMALVIQRWTLVMNPRIILRGVIPFVSNIGGSGHCHPFSLQIKEGYNMASHYILLVILFLSYWQVGRAMISRCYGMFWSSLCFLERYYCSEEAVLPPGAAVVLPS